MATLPNVLYWQPALGELGQFVTGLDDLAQAIRIIVTTPKGSIPHRPGFGCDLMGYIDRPQGLAMASMIREVQQALAEYEPRVTVSRVAVVPSALGASTLTIYWYPAGTPEASKSAATQPTTILAQEIFGKPSSPPVVVAPGALLISNVRVVAVTQDSVTISWSLNRPATGQVAYGATNAYGSLGPMEVSFDYTTHVQTISGLASGSDYHFSVRSIDQSGRQAASGDFTFSTIQATATSDSTTTLDPPMLANVGTNGCHAVNGIADSDGVRNLLFSVYSDDQAANLVYTQTTGDLVGLTPSRAYWVRTTAETLNGLTGVWTRQVSPLATFTTLTDQINAPTSVLAPTCSSITSSSVVVSNQILDSDGVRNVSFYLYGDAEGLYLVASNGTGTFTGLTANTGYWAKTSAQTLNSSTGEWASWTSPLCPVTTAEAIPSGISVKAYGAIGDGVTDDTLAIQACVDAVAGTGSAAIVPAGTYMINALRNNTAGIHLRSNMGLYLASGAVLKAIPNGAEDFDVVRARGLSNVTISGPGSILGERDQHTGSTGESGMGLAINTCSHVSVSGITSSNHWGDGIYVSDSCVDITVSNVICDNNRRQGMSITSVNGMLVSGGSYTNTNGTAPECGIDVEPNEGERVRDLHITGATITGNRGEGIQVGYNASFTAAGIQNVLIDFNTITSNGIGTRAAGDSATPAGIYCGFDRGATSRADGTVIENNTITGNASTGVLIGDSSEYVTVRNNTIAATARWNNITGDGVVIDNSDFCLIQNNNLTGNFGAGVWFLGPTGPNGKNGNILTPNTFSGNTGPDYGTPIF